MATWKYVQGAGMSYLITNRLNQDVFENFCLIPAKNYHDDGPDSNSFKAAYRDLSVFKPSNASNCEEDVGHFIFGIDQLHQSDSSMKDEHPYVNSQPSQEGGHLNIKMSSYQYWNPDVKYKMVLQLPYL